MALSTAELTDLQPRLLSKFTIPRRKTQHCFTLHLFKPLSSSLRSTKIPKTPSTNRYSPKKQPPSSSWIKKWPSQPPSQRIKSNSKKPESIHENTTAINRIVLSLRNLGLGSNDEDEEELDLSLKNVDLSDLDGSRNVELGDEKLGDLLRRDWVRPDTFLVEDEGGDYDDDNALLPWQRGVSEGEEVVGEDGLGVKGRVIRAPTLAELTIEDEELRRLRRNGMTLRERVNVPKARITGAVLEKIHDQWRKCELVRLKFHEELAHDMRTTREIVERRTGGLVTWRSGSVMVVFRGTNYEGPISRSQRTDSDDDGHIVKNVSSPDNSVSDGRSPVLENTIQQLKKEIGNPEDLENSKLWNSADRGQFNDVSELSESEDDEASMIGSDVDEDDDEASMIGSDVDEDDDDWDEYEDDDSEIANIEDL